MVRSGAALAPDSTPAPSGPGSTNSARTWWGGGLEALRENWSYLVCVLFCIDLQAIVLGRIELPLGVSFAYVSFSRNLAIVLVLGVLLGARDFRWPGSRLLVPFALFFALAWLSVLLGGGRYSEVRFLGTAFGLWVGARTIASQAHGRALLFHWLGILASVSVLADLVVNPGLLVLEEQQRHELYVAGHPNIFGGFLAILVPLLFGGDETAGSRRWGMLYGALALLGVVLTFSRLSLLGAGIGLVFVARGQPRAWWQSLAFGAGLLALMAMVVALFDGRSLSDWQRLWIMQTSFSLFREHWLLGLGWGSGNLESLFPARFEAMFGYELWPYHSHNLLMELLVGMGVLGTAAALWSFVRLAQVALSLLLRTTAASPRWRMAAGTVGSLITFFCLGLGEVPIYHARILLPLAVVWGLMEGREQAAKQDVRK